MRKKLNRLFSTKRRILAFGLGTTLALTTAGVALAFFTASGSGVGSANTATTSSLKIQQVGAGYDSLIPGSGDPYIQDQCFACAGITELGNDITLANPGTQQLVSVTVAMRNWNGAISNLPMTFTINNGIGGPVSDTQNFSFPAAIINGVNPSVTDITFDFSSQGAFVQQEFVYSLTFSATGAASGLNVALSSSANNLSIGTDTHPGTIWLSTTSANLGNDFPSCATPVPTGTFESVTTDGCTQSSLNPGAYGTPAEVAAGNADIPAVEINVVGGVTEPALFPGGPAEPVDFAITNPGSSTVRVHQVTTTVSSLTGAGTDGTIEACATSMYQLNNGTLTLNAYVPTGTTIFDPSGVSIYMINDGSNQDNCQGATVNLSFSSN